MHAWLAYRLIETSGLRVNWAQRNVSHGTRLPCMGPYPNPEGDIRRRPITATYTVRGERSSLASVFYGVFAPLSPSILKSHSTALTEATGASATLCFRAYARSSDVVVATDGSFTAPHDGTRLNVVVVGGRPEFSDWIDVSR